MPRGMAHGVPFKKMGQNPHKRLIILRSLVMALIKHERIEATFSKSSEAQKYAIRLIDIAKYGPENTYCKDMVEFWTDGDEEVKNKLFNILVPRYKNQQGKYTRLAMLPLWHNKDQLLRMSVLELKGNPLPPLPVKEENPYSLQNVLIAAAKNDWKKSHKQMNDTSSE
uniref:39S ribosomal protein L17, mitochondrial-like n=1 Tax=Styela clava TaxID=7725 RepID=UPI00193A5B9B|nr:39S ribosomal protein L17, mitochondrial-like [Styela clava]